MRKNFSLIELLVVIAIIAILSALLLSGLQKARQHAKTIKCLKNLQQIGVAAMFYTDDFKGFLAPAHNGTFYWAHYFVRFNYIPSSNWAGGPNAYPAQVTGIYNCPNEQFEGHPWNTWRGSHYGMSFYVGSWNVPVFGGGYSGNWFFKQDNIPIPSKVSRFGDCDYLTTGGGLFGYTAASMNIQARHFKGMNVLMVDGHAEWRHRDTIPVSDLDSNWYKHTFWGNKDFAKYWGIYSK